ncbi:MAG: MATE family efflux transporter [Bacteroidales bacterium]|jgi:putative MATE family efflux protein|nr:MATE family efflux transporter [Bacteroidales bacterium]MBR4714649.1 MATE family efflux transporter [Bacteroidales bacterium]MCR4932475.1 MATE family efflux transporter [Bacteroidales bacterium]
MTETPVPRLVLRLAVPSMVSMVVTALYNVVDAAFVGHLSTEATAGIGISFAYMTFIQAVGFFFGHGSGNHISRALGARQIDDAETMAAVGFFTPLILGLVATAVGLLFLPQLAVLLGATPDVVPYACSYLRYILIATPFMMSALVLNNQLRLQGNARFGMIGIVSGAVLNIVLDPLFIFVLDLGVAGASIATAVSQMFAWGLLLWGTTRDESVHIRLAKFKPSFGCYKEIVAGGLPSLFRQAFNCVSVIMLNFAASKYAPAGQAASSIAAFAIVSRTTMFAFSLILGFTQGFQPVCGFNYGAHKYGRVRQSYLFAFSVSAAMLTLLSALGFIFAPQIIAVFRDEDPALLAIGTAALRWQCVVFPLCTLSTSTNMLFQNIRMTFPATLLAIGRQGLFFVPAILVLPRIFGLQGVEMTQAVADVCTFFLSLPFAVWINRKLKSES